MAAPACAPPAATAPRLPVPADDRRRDRAAGWRPKFIDYLYVSLTNATAFSPTDTMPLTPMAKSIMGVQSLDLGRHDRPDRLPRRQHPLSAAYSRAQASARERNCAGLGGTARGRQQHDLAVAVAEAASSRKASRTSASG